MILLDLAEIMVKLTTSKIWNVTENLFKEAWRKIDKLDVNEKSAPLIGAERVENFPGHWFNQECIIVTFASLLYILDLTEQQKKSSVLKFHFLSKHLTTISDKD